MSISMRSRAINATTAYSNDEVIIPLAFNARTTGCDQPPLTPLRSELQSQGRAAIR